VNTYVTTKISYANMLADICDRLPGADVDTVTRALGADTRIGGKYLKGAMGYGGPCFPRDNVAFGKLAAKIGARADIALAADAINHHQVGRVTSLVKTHLDSSREVAVLGMAYKPDTPVVEESQGVMIARDLSNQGCSVVVYDPLAMEGARWDLEDALRNASTIVIATPSKEYAQAADRLKRAGTTVIDCWRVLDDAGEANLVHVGRG
jgi:UDPglucose 6-dehydrogenase